MHHLQDILLTIAATHGLFLRADTCAHGSLSVSIVPEAHRFMSHTHSLLELATWHKHRKAPQPVMLLSYTEDSQSSISVGVHLCLAAWQV